MGTETIIHNHNHNNNQGYIVKLNNPLMGTETFYYVPFVLNLIISIRLN